MRMILGLLFLCEHDFGAPLWPTAYVLQPAASRPTGATRSWRRRRRLLNFEAMQWRERRRFRDLPRPGDVTHSTAAQLDRDDGLLGVGGLDPEFEALGFADTVVRGGAPSGIGPRTALGAWIADQPAGRAFTAMRKQKRKGRLATDVEFSGAVPAVPRDWDAEGRWATILEGKWHWDPEHISTKEGRTTLMLLRRLGRIKRARHHRVLGIGDNLVSLCSFEGRAKSWCLNSLCRRSASYQIALRLRWQLRHIESKRNLCDAGSRRHELPEALPLTRARVTLAPATPATSSPSVACRASASSSTACRASSSSIARSATSLHYHLLRAEHLPHHRAPPRLLAQVSTPGYTGLVCACPCRGLP